MTSYQSTRCLKFSFLLLLQLFNMRICSGTTDEKKFKQAQSDSLVSD